MRRPSPDRGKSAPRAAHLTRRPEAARLRDWLQRTSTTALILGVLATPGCRIGGARESRPGRYTYQREPTAPLATPAYSVIAPDGSTMFVPGSRHTEGTSGGNGAMPGFPGIDPQGRGAGAAAQATVRDRPTLIAEQRARLAASPSAGDVQNDGGKTLIGLGETEDGIAALKRAAELAPYELAFVLDYAAALVAAGRVEAARDALVAAREYHPDDVRLTVSLARIAEALENWNEAAGLYAAASRAAEQSSRKNAAGSNWRRQEARCIYTVGRFAEARTLFAATLSPEDPTASFAELSLFGDACLRTEDFAMARRIFDELSRRSPVPSRDIELVRGLCALRMGEPGEAKRIASSAIEFWPNDAKLKQLAASAEQAEAPGPNDAQRAGEPARLDPKSGDERPVPFDRS